MQSIQFEGCELKPYAEPVQVHELRKGSVYFAVQYADRAMLTPIVETLVFIERSGNPDEGRVLFQTIDSYNEGVQYDSAVGDQLNAFRDQPEKQLNHIFDYEHALKELIKCALRRNRSFGRE
jgi:hypothetical protein